MRAFLFFAIERAHVFERVISIECEKDSIQTYGRLLLDVLTLSIAFQYETAPAESKKGQEKQQQQQKKKKKGGGGGGGKPAEKKPERPWTDELQADYDRILSVGEECISAGELKSLLTAKGRGSETAQFNLYDGFEPSGRMHIAQGVFKAMNVNKCTSSGGTFVFWVADWFALMNDKMGGDLDKIKIVGEYLQEVWKAAGMNLENVVFKWASDEITNKADQYWPQMLDVARRFTVTDRKSVV